MDHPLDNHPLDEHQVEHEHHVDDKLEPTLVIGTLVILCISLLILYFKG